MALRKIMTVEGEAFVETQSGNISLGVQKGSFTAYCKIVYIDGNKSTGRITLECSDGKYRKPLQYSVPFSVADDAPNFIKQAYEYLKTMPEWADAVDC